MKMLIILNEPAYGNERTYNGLRLALSLAKAEVVDLRVFLMGDSVTAAKPAQKTPDSYYNLERMLKGLSPKGIAVGACGTCPVSTMTLKAGVERIIMDRVPGVTEVVADNADAAEF